MDWLQHLHAGTLALLVPIVAIIVGGIVGGAVAITFAMIRHRERLAMIEKGIHPDTSKKHPHFAPRVDEPTPGGNF